MSTLFLSIFLLISLSVSEELHQIRPGDAYKMIGNFETYRTESNCQVVLAWLKPPMHSKMAFHGHESACSRVNFQPKETNGNQTGSMIDIWSLNELLNTEKFQAQERRSLKCFFIKNRIGDLAISVLIHPKPDPSQNLKIKMDILDLKKESTTITPQDILCARFFCPQPVVVEKVSTEAPKLINQPYLDLNASLNSNITTMNYRLTEKELLNRELNRQIIIYRIACALLSGLMIIFAIMTAGMCIRTRNYPRKLKQMSKLQQNYVMPYNFETNQTPSYYHMNGKLGLTPPSPLVSNDPHQNMDTNSVNNIIMTNSNLSPCDGHLGNGNQTYVSYPMTSGSMTNNEGMVAYVPVVNRPTISTARNYIVSCTGSTNQISLAQNNNGNCSPSSSILDGKMNCGSVNSSLTRQHSNNLSRRKIVVLGKNISALNSPDTTLSPNLLSQYNNHFGENTFGKSLHTPNLNGHDNVIHRFPNDFHGNGSRVNSEIETSSFMSTMNYQGNNTGQGNNNSNGKSTSAQSGSQNGLLVQ